MGCHTVTAEIQFLSHNSQLPKDITMRRALMKMTIFRLSQVKYDLKPMCKNDRD